MSVPPALPLFHAVSLTETSTSFVPSMLVANKVCSFIMVVVAVFARPKPVTAAVEVVSSCVPVLPSIPKH